MKIINWIVGIIIFIFAVSFAIAQYLVYFILNRNAKHQESADSLTKDPKKAKLAVEMLCGSEKWKQQVTEIAQKWQIQSYDGLRLYGYFLKGNSHDYALLCHGFTGSHREMVGRAQHFFDKGFSVLLPDARAHGESEGIYRGMGYLEQDDVKRWIQKIIDMDPQANIVLFGQSMGAATVMMTAASSLPKQVKCVIQDCGYISVWDEFAGQLKVRYHLPSFPIMNIANILSKKQAGYSFKEASPLNVIHKCRLPILMIHGEDDTFVPFEYLDKLYERANEPKYRLSVKNAGHCMSMVEETELYWKTIDNFLDQYL